MTTSDEYPVNMKLLVALAVLVSVCAAGAIPLDIPKDNSHYVEGETRYVWMSRGDNEPELVDLQEPADEAFMKARNGAGNQYFLLTRQNQHHPHRIFHNNINSVRNSQYRNTRGTVVLVHGWLNNLDTPMNPAITQAFLRTMDVNVIVVDWSHVSRSTYGNAVRGVPSVGDHLGDFLGWLFRSAGGNWNQVHLIGFSLGAHVVGNAGRRVGGQARRVTGLDPAGPRWGGNLNSLTRAAGRYVEAIHTDGRAYGIMNPVGHADFYPNGGRHPQPGCGPARNYCSHGRAPELFESSVLHPNRFRANWCRNIAQAEISACTGHEVVMGNGVIGKTAYGLFGLRTVGRWPF